MPVFPQAWQNTSHLAPTDRRAARGLRFSNLGAPTRSSERGGPSLRPEIARPSGCFRCDL